MPSLLSQIPDRLVEHGPEPGVFTFVGRELRPQPVVLPLKRFALGGETLHPLDDRHDAILEKLSGRFAHVSIRRSRTPGIDSATSTSSERYASASASVSVRSSGSSITRSVIAISPPASGGPRH